MLSILVLSSDGYSDCWEPFFELFRRNFPLKKDYELLLSTNSKHYEHRGLEIRVLKHENDASWSKRLKDSLKQCSYSNVLVLVEDFFLLSPMDEQIFSDCLKMLNSEVKIDHIRLLYKTDKLSLEGCEFKNLRRIKNPSKYRFLFLPGLWRKNILDKYIVEFESPFMAEKMGDPRSWILNDGFYAVKPHIMGSGRYFYDCATSGAIIKGKWGKWLPNRLRNENISIDFSVRGFKDLDSNREARSSIYKNLVLNPKETLRSIFSLLKLIVKRKS